MLSFILMILEELKESYLYLELLDSAITDSILNFKVKELPCYRQRVPPTNLCSLAVVFSQNKCIIGTCIERKSYLLKN